jgi:hypothetical protein
LYCQFFFDLYLLDYLFGIFWSLYDTKGVIKKVLIKEGLTIQWPKDTKGVIQKRKSKKG